MTTAQNIDHLSALTRWRNLISWIRSHYFTFALLLYIAGFIVLPTSKMVNNVFYIFIGLPTLWTLLTRRTLRIQPASLTEWLWWLLLGWFAIAGYFYGHPDFCRHVFYVLVFVLALTILVEPGALPYATLARTLFWSVTAYILFAACYYWFSQRYAFGARIENLPSRMREPIFTSIWQAACLAFVLPLWLQQKKYPEAALGFLLTFFCSSFILQSRSGIVGFFVALSFIPLYSLYKRNVRILIFMAIALLVTLLVFIILQQTGLYEVLTGRADTGRLIIWQHVTENWARCSWLRGCGLNFEIDVVIHNQLIQHPHNIFLALGIFTGIPGLFVFILIVISSLVIALRRHDPWGAYLCVTVVSLNFDGGLLIGKQIELMLLIFLPALMIINRNRLPVAQTACR